MILLLVIVLFVGIGIIFCLLYYPRQIMAPGKLCELTTPNPEKYQNDCLHPCVRRLKDGTYVMIQSPWPAAQDGVENPILYFSKNPTVWKDGVIIKDTPTTGYNSDPFVFVDDDQLYVFWREVDTPLCQEVGYSRVIVGGKIGEDRKVINERIYLGAKKGIMSPILIKRNNKYYFYTIWNQVKPYRKNLGVEIWEGTSLENPDFELIDKVRIKRVFVWDKLFERYFLGHMFIIPMIKRYDLWHFDLLEHDGILYMVSSSNMDHHIMMSVSNDWKHFTTLKYPLLNNNGFDRIVDHGCYFYKPTAQIIDNQLYLWYTSNNGWPYKNKLYMTTTNFKDLV